jgi:hypothetical protein
MCAKSGGFRKTVSNPGTAEYGSSAKRRRSQFVAQNLTVRNGPIDDYPKFTLPSLPFMIMTYPVESGLPPAIVSLTLASMKRMPSNTCRKSDTSLSDRTKRAVSLRSACAIAAKSALANTPVP